MKHSVEPFPRPKRVRVGPMVYEISYPANPGDTLADESNAPRKWGYISHTNLKLYVNSECHEDQMRDTLLHEIVHAAESAADLELTEHQVTALSTQLLGILQGNPRVVDYLTKRKS